MIIVLKEENVIGKTNIYRTTRRQNMKSTIMEVLRLLEMNRLRNSKVLKQSLT